MASSMFRVLSDGVCATISNCLELVMSLSSKGAVGRELNKVYFGRRNDENGNLEWIVNGRQEWVC